MNCLIPQDPKFDYANTQLRILVTYCRTALLVEPLESSESALQRVLIDESIQYENNIMKTVYNTMNISKINDENDYEYYLFNNDMNGFFRVLYDQQSFDFILNVWLNSDKLSDFNKFEIISDQYAFMISNYISGTQYLQFLYTISKIEQKNGKFLIWDIIINSLMTIDSLFCEKHLNDTQNVINNFRNYAIEIITPVWTQINQWNITENDSENIINLRSLIINAMIRFNNQSIIKYGYDLFIRELINNNKIFVNKQGELTHNINTNILRQVIECALTYQAQNNNNSLPILQLFFDIYTLLNSEYQQYFLRAIGAVYTNFELNSNALSFILSNNNNNVRDQDKLRALYSLNRCYGREALWKYLSNAGRWDGLFNIYGSGFSAQGLTEIPNTFASFNYYNKIYEFYYQLNGHKTLSNERSVNETIENIQINIQWIENNYYKISKYLFQLYDQNNENEKSENNYAIYIVIGIVILIVLLLFLTIGFKYIWKKYLSKRKLFTYKRQVNEIDTDENNNYSVAINSIDDNQYDQDDQNL